MRLWNIHPKYLDPIGLIALWREALLAQAVLNGKTKGYKNHPQLIPFKAHPYPKKAIATYLEHIYRESTKRGYNFNKNRINKGRTKQTIRTTNKALRNEFIWLLNKLARRSRKKYLEIRRTRLIDPHPLFIK